MKGCRGVQCTRRHASTTPSHDYIPGFDALHDTLFVSRHLQDTLGALNDTPHILARHHLFGRKGVVEGCRGAQSEPVVENRGGVVGYACRGEHVVKNTRPGMMSWGTRFDHVVKARRGV